MFKKALILMCAAEAVSLLAFVWPSFSLPLLILAGCAALFLSWKNLEWGIYILLGELFFGSRGHLLEADMLGITLSARLIFFVAVFFAWALREFPISNFQFPNKSQIQNPKSKTLYILLLAVIGFGIINGYLRGNGIANVFNDANGYLYLLILPAVLSVIKTRQQVDKILQILAAAIIIIAAKTLLLFVWFSFGLPGVATAYHWIISQDFGEITGDVGKASRIFMQSQFWALMGLFIWGIGGIREIRGKNLLIVSAALLSVLMSLSRSFWLGAVAGGLFALGIVLWRFRSNFRGFLALGLKIGLIAIVEIALLYGLVSIGGNAISQSVSSRGGDPTKEAASGARLLLLPELARAIKQDAILGAGFGKIVSYKSYLPDRVTPDNPEGVIKNFAFEWGYLDIMLKVGILGFIIYLLFIAQIFRQWFEMQNVNIKMQNLGILSGLAGLLALNVTTPYLNHPLGIGYIILSLTVFSIRD